jgi:hypothetical protein
MTPHEARKQRPAAATSSTAAKPTIPLCHGKRIYDAPCGSRWHDRTSSAIKAHPRRPKLWMPAAATKSKAAQDGLPGGPELKEDA